MSFLLDTNVLSELRKRERADPGVLGWIHGIDSDELFLSVLVVGELRQGVERVRRRDGNAAAHLERWLDALISQHEDRILGVDVKVAEMWGRLNVPDPLPAVDGLLAATAIVHGMTLVTRNVRDIAATGVPHLNPFQRP